MGVSCDYQQHRLHNGACQPAYRRFPVVTSSRTSSFSYWLFWRSRREMRPTVSPLSSEQTVLDLIKNHTGPTEKHIRSSMFSSSFLPCLFSVCFSARLVSLVKGGVLAVVVGLSKKKSIYLSVLFGQSYSLHWIKAFTKLFVENGDDA